MRVTKSPISASLVADEVELIEAGEGIHDKDNKRTRIKWNPTSRKPFPSRSSLRLQGSSGKAEWFTNPTTFFDND